MGAPLRIRTVLGGGSATDDATKNYIARLVKLIPSEVVGLYLAGRSAIETQYPLPKGGFVAGLEAPGALFWIGWTIVCLIGVVAIRVWTTSDAKQNTPIEWPAVGIATVSFLIWVYSFGDVFRIAIAVPGWSPLFATLLVLAWTFAVPLLYREK